MKNILLFILLVCSSNLIIAQDTLSIRSGENILVKVVEVSSSKMIFKELDNPNESVFSILELDFLMIKYENGTIDSFSVENKNLRKLNPRLSNPFGININLLGQTGLLSFSVDYFVSSSLDIELGAGIFGTFGGLKYHFGGANTDKNWTPYLGIYLSHIPAIVFFTASDSKNCIYMPMGIQLHKNKGLTFGAELAITNLTKMNVWGGLKFGYHF